MIKTQLADYYVKNQCKQVPFVTLCVKKLWQRMGVKKIIYKLASRQLWMAPYQDVKIVQLENLPRCMDFFL